MKLAIMGLGGIGGYVGGALTKAGEDVAFIARGAQLEAITKNGLTVKSDVLGQFTVRPRIATQDIETVGEVDAVIFAVKSYALEEASRQIAPIVGSHTLVLPLLNGVGNGERIAKILGKGQVLEGAIYVTAMIQQPGVIFQGGANSRIIMGAAAGRPADAQKIMKLADCIKGSGISCAVSDDATASVWTKYNFICAFGCVSSAYEATAGQICDNPLMMADFTAVCQEIYLVAKAMGVGVSDSLPNDSIAVLRSLPYEATSSVQRDLKEPGKQNEVDSYCAQAARLGKVLGVDTPVCQRFAELLR